jgi:hypothetical protein
MDTVTTSITKATDVTGEIEKNKKASIYSVLLLFKNIKSHLENMSLHYYGLFGILLDTYILITKTVL